MLFKLLVLLSFAGGTFLSGNVMDHYFSISGIDKQVAPNKVDEKNLGVIVSAEKFIAIDVRSGKVLLQKDPDKKQPIASLTKLLTALVIADLENIEWNKRVELIEQDETVGAMPHLYRGEEVSFEDLFYSALVSSDNNSIIAMIRSLGISRSEFIEMMNNKAQDLEMFDSVFDDPTGLSKQNISTAYDVAKLVYSAMKNDKIAEAVLSKSHTIFFAEKNKKRILRNTDILLNSFLNNENYGYDFLGGKTGFIPEAGYCLGVKISKNGYPVVIIVLDSESIESRFNDVKVIADWVFENYNWPK